MANFKEEYKGYKIQRVKPMNTNKYTIIIFNCAKATCMSNVEREDLDTDETMAQLFNLIEGI